MSLVSHPTIVIIGGGFSGALTAVHLLKRGFGAVGRLVLVNRSGAMARGVAYGTTSEFHVLNVPAGRMSAFDDDPDSFVRFVRERGVTVDGAPIDGGSFVGRHLYGAYLESLLTEACAQAPEGCVERLNTEVVAIIQPPNTDPSMNTTAMAHRLWVSLRDGRRIRATRVVLAVGNYPPEDPPVDCDGFFTSSRRYVRDPWSPGAFDRIDLDTPILLIGTGLTMVDVALQLQALGAAATMTAVSRRGLLPASHRNPAHVPHTHDLPQDADRGSSEHARLHASGTPSRAREDGPRHRLARHNRGAPSRHGTNVERAVRSGAQPLPAPRTPVLGSPSPSHGAAALRRIREPAHVRPRQRDRRPLVQIREQDTGEPCDTARSEQ